MFNLKIDNDNNSLLTDEINNIDFNILINEIFFPNMIVPNLNIFNSSPYYKDNRSYISEERNHPNINKDNNAEINLINKNIFQIKYEKSTNTTTFKNKEIIPEFYSMNKIIEKIFNDGIKNELKAAELEKTNEYNYMESLNKIWKKNQKQYDYNYSENEKREKERRGRKRKSNFPIIEHNRMTADNIIKKIKNIIMKNIIDFLNQLLKETTKNVKLCKLDYKYSNQINRAVEFKLLRMKLKELASLDISPKYVKVQKYYNREIIKKIINKEKSIIDETQENYYNTLMFVFNLTFSEWLDLLTVKKNVKDLASYYKVNGKINVDLIENNFVGINQILSNFEENENYFARFVFYFYNYERWFYLKTGRIIKKKKYYK